MSATVSHFEIDVTQVRDFEFTVRFDKEGHAPLLLDEPPPLGQDGAPNAARILAAAIGNCLAASLVFCAKRKGTALTDVKAHVALDVVRNEQKRLRIGKVRVRIEAPLGAAAVQECLPLFEDFCTVTQSVRAGLDVEVEVVAPPT
jgi:uncharacterized OsmC-like protein